MSEIVDIVETLESKLKKIFQKMDNLEQANSDLNQKLEQSSIVVRNQLEQIEALKTQYETLKLSNSLLGSDENKRETKLKINSLIREIDYCIAQLAD